VSAHPISFNRLIIGYIDTLDFVTNSFLMSFARINADIAREIIKSFVRDGKEVLMLVSDDSVAEMIKRVIGFDIPVQRVVLPPISENDMLMLFAFPDQRSVMIYVCTSFKPVLRQFIPDTKRYIPVLSRRRNIPGVDV